MDYGTLLTDAVKHPQAQPHTGFRQTPAVIHSPIPLPTFIYIYFFYLT